MKALICRDDGQLRRVESAIAAIEAAQPSQRQAKLGLLEALRAERATLQQHAQRQRGRVAVPRNRRPAWLASTMNSEHALG